jgi:CelD/BcsL family acetyltransferase involved in cellulose biosynthesis
LPVSPPGSQLDVAGVNATSVDVSYLRSLEDVDREEWCALAERAGNVFASPEWLLTWWSHFGNGRAPLVGVARDAGELVAIMPTYEWWAHGVPVLRFIGHGPGDQLGPISASADPRTGAAVAELLDALPLRGFLLLAEQVSGDHQFGEANSARRLYREANPVLRIRGESWEEFMLERSGNFRQQVRRFPRKAAKLGTLSYRLASDPAQLERDLDILFDLHRRRWAGVTPFLRAEAFHREFARRAQRRGWLRLWFLEIDERPVAAEMGFRFAGAEFFYQSGRDPAFRQVPLGFLVLVNAIREGLRDGVREYRLLRGGEPYKLRLATDDPGLETYGLPRGAAARVLLASARAARGNHFGLRSALDRL